MESLFEKRKRELENMKNPICSNSKIEFIKFPKLNKIKLEIPTDKKGTCLLDLKEYEKFKGEHYDFEVKDHKTYIVIHTEYYYQTDSGNILHVKDNKYEELIDKWSKTETKLISLAEESMKLVLEIQKLKGETNNYVKK